MEEINLQGQLRSILEPTGPAGKGGGPGGSKPAVTSEGKTFQETLMESIEKVNDLQQEANTSLEKLATGESKDVHNTVIALQKASVSFKLMMEVRNKLVDAYKEVMRSTT